ncbi:MAG: hypothetical protein ACRECD_00785, partial [Burkholderiaceae bacterium]
MSQASSVLILGARGRFGIAAARAFAQAGWQVHAQLRPGATGPAIAGVQWLAAAPEDTATLMARSFVAVAEQRHRLPAFETLHFAGYGVTGQD